jgi:protein-S-isoprenylcysteine O-methyltransferase Ste14
MATNPGNAIARGWQQLDAVDIGERLVVLALFGWFVSHIIPSVADHPYNLLILGSETLTALLVLIRRPGPMATSLYAWAIAIVGTCAPLLVLPADGGIGVPVALAASLMTTGLFLSLAAKAFLRRSFGIVAASRGVRRGGPYRLMRHPMYAGYIVTQIGFLSLNPSLWNAAVYALAWTTLVLRIAEEEKILSQDPAYRDFQADVRYRLFPGLY